MSVMDPGVMTTEPTRGREPVGALIDRVGQQARLELRDAVPMPAQAYWDEELYGQEIEKIFKKDWLCLARTDEVPDAGDYFAIDIADEPLIVVRGEDSQVRVFSRVCRHRYEDLLGGGTPADQRRTGCAKRFVCPYHDWAYRLDGELFAAPDMVARPGFDMSAFNLREVRSTVWQGFVFVNLSGDLAEPLDMSGIEGILGGYDFTDWEVASVIDWGTTKVNWKIVVENFSEAYHHLGLHKSSAQPIWPFASVQMGDEVGPEWFYSRLFVGADAATGEVNGHLVQPTWLTPQPGLSQYELSQGILFAKFPTFMMLPAPDITFWFRMFPTAAEYHQLEILLMVHKSSYAHPEFKEKIHEATEFFRDVQGEDASCNERIQSSTRSVFATGGVLHPQEQPLWQLQKYVSSRLAR